MHKVIRYFKFFGPFVFLALFLWVIFYATPRLIKVNEIYCESQYGPCDSETELELRETSGQSLHDAKKNISEYLSQISTVSDFTSRYQIPDKINIHLILKKPHAGLYSGQGQLALVDEDGVVLSYSETTSLPILRIKGVPPSVGDKVDKNTLFSLKIFTYMNMVFDVSEGELEDEVLKFPLREGPQVLFPKEGDQKVLIGSLILIVNKLNNGSLETTMEDNRRACGQTCTIDLRFKNPVVKI